MAKERPDLQAHFDLETNYNQQFNQVEIIANTSTLEYLRDVIQDLISNGKSGSHYQYDEVAGLSGNVTVLVIGKR